MYLHGHVHESNVAVFGRNNLWLVVGVCVTHGSSGSVGGGVDTRRVARGAGRSGDDAAAHLGREPAAADAAASAAVVAAGSFRDGCSHLGVVSNFN